MSVPNLPAHLVAFVRAGNTEAERLARLSAAMGSSADALRATIGGTSRQARKLLKQARRDLGGHEAVEAALRR